MNLMKISVVIPTYKPKDWIKKCLDSLANQTFNKDDYELIIVLNGCDEPYRTLIQNCVSDMKAKVHFMQTDMAGVSNARNMALDYAKGDYIAFVDDDDYVSPSYLQELYDIAITGVVPVSNLVAFSDMNNEVIDNYISRLYQQIKGKKRVSILRARSFISVPVAKILPRRLIGLCRFDTRLRNGEDCLFMLQISDKISHLAPTSESAIYYRRVRPESAATRKRPLGEVLACKSRLLVGYGYCLIQPWRYNLLFVLSRIVACLIIWK